MLYVAYKLLCPLVTMGCGTVSLATSLWEFVYIWMKERIESYNHILIIASKSVTTWSWFVEEFHVVSRFGECQSVEVQIEKRMFLIWKEWTYKVTLMWAVSGKEHSSCECTTSNLLVHSSQWRVAQYSRMRENTSNHWNKGINQNSVSMSVVLPELYPT